MEPATNSSYTSFWANQAIHVSIPRLGFASEIDGGWPIAGVIVGIDRVQVCNLCARSLPILKKSKTHDLES